MAEPFSDEELKDYRRYYEAKLAYLKASTGTGMGSRLYRDKIGRFFATIDADRKRIAELEAENERLKEDIAEQDEIDRIAESGKEEKKKLPGWKDVRGILRGNKEEK